MEALSYQLLETIQFFQLPTEFEASGDDGDTQVFAPVEARRTP
jgi:hypothetical protein